MKNTVGKFAKQNIGSPCEVVASNISATTVITSTQPNDPLFSQQWHLIGQ